jgi:hypothetical protein
MGWTPMTQQMPVAVKRPIGAVGSRLGRRFPGLPATRLDSTPSRGFTRDG